MDVTKSAFTVKIFGGKFNFCAVQIVNDNRKFWKTVSKLFSQKAYQKEFIMIKNKVTDENISKSE